MEITEFVFILLIQMHIHISQLSALVHSRSKPSFVSYTKVALLSANGLSITFFMINYFLVFLTINKNYMKYSSFDFKLA